MGKDSKIFIDSDEEVNFIVEKIKNAPSDRVAVVVPDGAAVLRSGVSLRLLKKQAENAGKKVVLVTMDDSAKGMCTTAGIKCLGRVGDLSDSTWTSSTNKKPEEPQVESPPEPAEKTEEKSGLLDRVGEEQKVEAVKGVEEIELDEEVETEKPTKEGEKANLEEEFEFEVGKEIRSETAQETQAEIEGQNKEKVPLIDSVKGAVMGVFGKIKLPTKSKSAVGEVTTPAAAETPDEFVVPAQKRARSMELKGYSAPRRTLKVNLAKRAPAAKAFSSKKREFGAPQRKGKTPGGGGAGIAGIFGKITGVFGKIPKGRWQLITGGVVALALFIVFAYVYWLAPRVRIVMYVQQQTISETFTVTGNTGTQAVTTEPPTIPLFSHATTDDGSDSIEATEQTERGDPATGTVSIFNITPEAAIIPDATILTCTSAGCQGKQFKTKGALTIPAGSSDRADVEATAIGEEYNIAISQDFKVGDFNQSSEVFGRNVSPFSGGTKEDVILIAEGDKTSLETSLEEALKSTCKSKLRHELADDTSIVDKSYTFEVVEKTFDKNVGDEADYLNLQMDVGCSALIYRQGDLTELGIALAQGMVGEGFGMDETGVTVGSSEISSTTTSAEFEISVHGEANPDLDRSELKAQLKAKSKKDAAAELDKLTNIDKYEITYSPTWAPGFLQHIPSNEKDILIEFRQVDSTQNDTQNESENT